MPELVFGNLSSILNGFVVDVPKVNSPIGRSCGDQVRRLRIEDEMPGLPLVCHVGNSGLHLDVDPSVRVLDQRGVVIRTRRGRRWGK